VTVADELQRFVTKSHSVSACKRRSSIIRLSHATGDAENAGLECNGPRSKRFCVSL